MPWTRCGEEFMSSPTVTEPELQFIDVGAGGNRRRIAYRKRNGAGPAVVWCGGFKSDMASTKAARIDAWCAAQGRAMVRMDYAGHGESSGRFQDFVVSDWVADAEAVLARVVDGPAVIVGSSMGGWIAVLIAKRQAEANGAGLGASADSGNPHPERVERSAIPASSAERVHVAGLVLIAPACDFTEDLMWPQFPEHVKAEIMDKGVFQLPSAYSPEPTPITRALIEDGRNNRVFGRTFRVNCPVHILQGMKDPDIPFGQALKLVEHLPLDPVTVTLISDGNHRLSREEDIARLIAAVAGMG
jgi:pimeloyl-ACP methyl ester carboxylesterase